MELSANAFIRNTKGLVPIIKQTEPALTSRKSRLLCLACPVNLRIAKLVKALFKQSLVPKTMCLKTNLELLLLFLLAASPNIAVWRASFLHTYRHFSVIVLVHQEKTVEIFLRHACWWYSRMMIRCDANTAVRQCSSQEAWGLFDQGSSPGLLIARIAGLRIMHNGSFATAAKIR